MSRQTEKVINGLHKFLEANGGAEDEEELQKLIRQYMNEYNSSLMSQPKLTESNAKTSEDWMEPAEEADNPEDAARYAKKALKLDPYNYDTAAVIIFSENTMPHIMIEQLSELAEKATEHMKELGHIPRDVGDFRGVNGTRPYIRLLERKMYMEKQCGMSSAAIRDCEEILRLNNRDNMGVRFSLMALYALFLKDKEAEDLMARYSEDGYAETSLALPLSILYYRLGNMEKAKEILLKLAKVNRDTKKFFWGMINDDLDKYVDKMSDKGYRPNTMEEYMRFMQEESVLAGQAVLYFLWADDALKNESKLKRKIKKKFRRR